MMKLREKPPILSSEKKDMILNMTVRLTNPLPLIEVMKFADAVAESQRDADVQWFLEKHNG